MQTSATKSAGFGWVAAAGPPILVAAAALYPPIVSFLDQGMRAVFAYFAADSFYYLTIAQNAVDGPVSSFDGATLTNGYHPLWQMFLIGAFRMLGPDQSTQLVFTFLTSAALVAVGLTLFALAIRRITGSAWAGLWMIPGIFTFLSVRSPFTVDRGLTYTYSSWALINGMETPLSVALGGILVFLLSGPARDGASPAHWPLGTRTLIGVVVALMVLSRLDDVFLPIAFAIFLLAGSGWGKGARRSAAFLAPTALCLAVYLAINLRVFGMLLPVSGQIKSGWPLGENLGIIAADLFPPIHLLIGGDWELEGWIYSAQRTLLLVVPALLSFVLLRAVFTSQMDGQWKWLPRMAANARWIWLPTLAPILVYILFKALYNLVRVEITQQGYWYFPLFLLFFNFLAILMLHDALSMPGLRRALAGIWVVLYLIASANAQHLTTRTSWAYDVWEKRALLREGILARRPEVRLIDFADGAFAYSLDLPSMPMTALATDRAGLEAVRQDRYPRYCLSRGHDVAVLSPRSYSLSTPWLVMGAAQPIWSEEETGVEFIEIRARPGAAATP
jgi:hypothetical protein